MDEYLSRWSAATPFCSRIMSRALRPWWRSAAQRLTVSATRDNSLASRLKRFGMGLMALGLSQGALAWRLETWQPRLPLALAPDRAAISDAILAERERDEA